MDTKKNIDDPLDEFSLDDLEEEIKAELSDDKKRQESNKTESKTNFTIKKNYGKLSNRSNSPLFALINRRGQLIYDLRHWKDDNHPGKGITFSRGELLNLYKSLLVFDFCAIYDKPIRQCEIGSSTVSFFCLISKLSTTFNNKKGTWQKEVNLIDWGCGIRVDFRRWTPDYKQHSKGLRISLNELKTLKSIIEIAI